MAPPGSIKGAGLQVSRQRRHFTSPRSGAQWSNRWGAARYATDPVLKREIVRVCFVGWLDVDVRKA
eukprot:652845-Rhodomonas_salina.8